MLNKTLVQFTTLLIALSSLQTISGSPLPLKTARAAALEKRKEASESESEKAAEPTQITVWQRPKFKDKQFKTANSDLIFPNLGDMSLGYNNALGKIKGVTVLTTKMKGQDAPITATLKEKIIVDDDSYEEKVVIKGDGKKWQDVISCEITDPEKKEATCVLKHYAEGDSDTVTATATNIGLRQGKLKVYPLVHIDDEEVSSGVDKVSSLYASFTAT